MAKFDYSVTQATALRLIERFGRDIQLQEKNSDLIDANKPYLGSADSPSKLDTVGAFVEFESRDINGSILIRDQMLIIPNQEKVITKSFQVIDDSQIWKIVEVLSKIKPGPLIVAYILQVRL